jgi:sulfur carrier protein
MLRTYGGGVNVQVNGSKRAIADGATVADLIVSLGLRAKGVVVERNGDAVQRSTFGAIRLKDGDVLEVVRAVPGG